MYERERDQIRPLSPAEYLGVDETEVVCENCRTNPISDNADEHHLWCDGCLEARF
jgi:hypothetical protein